ncbi:MAG: alkaline phosphatase family protein [Actinomycetota bacterium]
MDRCIKHVVVLMLENRSFDHMLGFLEYPGFPTLEPPADYSNPSNPTDPHSRRIPVTKDADYTMRLDPPHSHQSVMEQLHVTLRGGPQMDGFVAAYSRKAAGLEARPRVHWWRLLGLGLILSALLGVGVGVVISPLAGVIVFLIAAAAVGGGLASAKRRVDNPPTYEAGPEVMQCMDPDKIPVLATLAKEFAVCTRWHCSVPGETWPNRCFAHAATSEESVDIEVGFYSAPTIFDLLERNRVGWRIYCDGRAQLWAFRNLWLDDDRRARWRSTRQLVDDIEKNDLATYSFIEPDHHGEDSGSQHPNNNRPSSKGVDFVRGEQLISQIYSALKKKRDVFSKTMFVITYDEHGGLYDHVPPPTRMPAPKPLKRLRLTRRIIAFFIERTTARFAFRMLGPRVPTVVVSPLIPRATVDDRVYDHSSIVATVRRLFAPDAPPLTARDEHANTFEHLASLSAPRGPEDLPDPTPPPLDRERAVVEELPPEAEDEYSRQLEVIGNKVRDALAAEGIEDEGPAVRGATESPSVGDPAVRLFNRAAHQARTRISRRSNGP